MLVAAALKNRTCFRDRQVLDMQAFRNVEDRFSFRTGVPRVPRLHRVAAVYGPNGSGKSRLVEGLAFAQWFVVNSSKDQQAGERIPYEPFLFDEGTRTAPTEFDFIFVQGDVLYEYGFAIDGTRVHREWLLARHPGGRMRRLLERELDPATDDSRWKFGASVRGARSVWRRNTRPNALLVSTAVQLNSDIFRSVVDWFRRLRFIRAGELPPVFSARAVERDQKTKKRVLTLLHAADIAVSDLTVDLAQVDPDELKNQLPPAVHQQLRQTGARLDVTSVSFLHSPKAGAPASVDLDEESDGTQRYFSLAAPWLEVLDNDDVLVVDELDRSLHPRLVRALVEQFNREPNGGSGTAQLVATVHEPTLLDYLDRGQVWLAEKDRQTEAASLTPLSDYSPRKGEALMRGYLRGRYGAVPVTVPPEALG